MRRALVLFIALALPFAAGAQTTTPTLPDPGMLPDSPLYFLKSWGEGLGTIFTFNAEKKVNRLVHLAGVRLAEYEKLVQEGKTEIANQALKRYEESVDRTNERAEAIKDRAPEVQKHVAEVIKIQHTILEQGTEQVPEPAHSANARPEEAGAKEKQVPESGVSVSIVSPADGITIGLGKTTLFSAEAHGGSEKYHYVWNFSDGTGPRYDLSSYKGNTNSISYSFDRVGTYTVTVTASDSNGVTATAQNKVSVFEFSSKTPGGIKGDIEQ